MQLSRHIVTIGLTLIFLTGCFPYIVPYFPKSHSMFEFQQILFNQSIINGSSSQEDVIAAFGKPYIRFDKFILYKDRVKSREARLAYGIAHNAGTYGSSNKTMEGVWMDAIFEFDDHGILTKNRFLESEHSISNIEITEFLNEDMAKNLAECSSKCQSQFYSCLNATEGTKTYLTQCEETLNTCFRSCEEKPLLLSRVPAIREWSLAHDETHQPNPHSRHTSPLLAHVLRVGGNVTH